MQTWFKFKPTFKEMIWGGDRLKTEFGFDIPSEHTGEAWIISAHPQGESIVENGDAANVPLSQLYKMIRPYFGPGKNQEFPIMVKIIDANKDLSVQVHPDDEYARRVEESLGKSESWYVLDCQPETRMVMGHHARTSDEFNAHLLSGNYDTLFRNLTINKGDCFHVPAGTIHAICEGSLIYEAQENSNVTYRVYDYDRMDAKGNKRELHLRKAMEVTQSPCKPDSIKNEPIEIGKNYVTYLVENEYFQMRKYEVNDVLTMDLGDVFMIISVIDGHGTINDNPVVKGDSFIALPKEEKLAIKGPVTLLIVEPKAEKMM
ncbi:MAG: class I mannose-6-phosphate isomerase [Erysipelotrichaceae bacterium]|nr:class I mannose-6-phosphate isomerase [Erysipelotrichaceae bacterium]MDP3305893.1 class I mannose-6-phosphate isomerase [Erysipelotrichaceae bacterium]